MSLPGAYMQYPEAWEKFVKVIPENDRPDMIAAYDRLFSRSPKTPTDIEYQNEAARAWSSWEGSTSYLAPHPDTQDEYEKLSFAKAFARIENH